MVYECRVCEEIKPDDHFFNNGRGFIDKICRSCKHERMQQRRRNFKDWAIEYKGGKCIVCGYTKCRGALDFHHLDPNEKEFIISKAGLMKKEKAIKELDKCVLLCKNCHAEVHAGLLDLDAVMV